MEKSKNVEAKSFIKPNEEERNSERCVSIGRIRDTVTRFTFSHTLTFPRYEKPVKKNIVTLFAYSSRPIIQTLLHGIPNTRERVHLYSYTVESRVIRVRRFQSRVHPCRNYSHHDPANFISTINQLAFDFDRTRDFVSTGSRDELKYKKKVKKKKGKIIVYNKGEITRIYEDAEIRKVGRNTFPRQHRRPVSFIAFLKSKPTLESWRG